MAGFEADFFADWDGGDCDFRMSVPINGGPPSPRPRITGDLILVIDRFRADGRRQSPHTRVILPIPLLDTTRMALTISARIEVVHAVVEAWSRNQFHGGLPEAIVLVLADQLSRFFRYVAGEMGAAPDITYISAVGRVRLFDADGRGEDLAAAEEEGDGEEVAMGSEGEGDGEVVAMQEEMGGEGEGEEGEGDGEEMGEEGLVGEEGEEGEETRCAICLGRMASSAEGGWERWWLPCCHCFHRGCVQRWLQQKAECPLCRAPAAGGASSSARGRGLS